MDKWPYHVLKQIKLVNQQQEKVRRLVLPYIKSTAWNAHSEHVLQTMLCSESGDERKFAITKILEIRDDENKGSLKPRPRLVQSINTDATCLQNIIHWSSDVHEPPLTCDFSKIMLLEYTDTPMSVPTFPVRPNGYKGIGFCIW